ncbi:MAG TPA: MarR family transcriptional regulator [Ktedonobacterales bacterium]|nr:MarR family transcriptional regulator [Ktedonobacterales bacterium]
MNRLAVATWMRLARVFLKVERAGTEQLRRWDLSMAQFDVLAQVGAAEGMTQQELADVLLVTKGNVCQLLDRMERSALLRRSQEGRVNRLYLTEAGRRLFNEVVPAHEALLAAQLGTLSLAEQRQLLDLLRRVDRALEPASS